MYNTTSFVFFLPYRTVLAAHRSHCLRRQRFARDSEYDQNDPAHAPTMIRSHASSSQTNLDHLVDYQGDTFSAVQSIFSGVTCYQLLANSNKAIVFETSIPFQLAFFALVEHDTDVAPLWDPARRQFVGLMTISDYVQALQVCRRQGISMLDLSTRSITGLVCLETPAIPSPPPPPHTHTPPPTHLPSQTCSAPLR